MELSLPGGLPARGDVYALARLATAFGSYALPQASRRAGNYAPACCNTQPLPFAKGGEGAPGRLLELRDRDAALKTRGVIGANILCRWMATIIRPVAQR